eukprot:365225-Chlamydomonas_euryale.AAC.5
MCAHGDRSAAPPSRQGLEQAFLKARNAFRLSQLAPTCGRGRRGRACASAHKAPRAACKHALHASTCAGGIERTGRRTASGSRMSSGHDYLLQQACCNAAALLASHTGGNIKLSIVSGGAPCAAVGVSTQLLESLPEQGAAEAVRDRVQTIPISYDCTRLL